jgi:hypothetical protein
MVANFFCGPSITCLDLVDFGSQAGWLRLRRFGFRLSEATDDEVHAIILMHGFIERFVLVSGFECKLQKRSIRCTAWQEVGYASTSRFLLPLQYEGKPSL